jgi:hypothetical protein
MDVNEKKCFATATSAKTIEKETKDFVDMKYLSVTSLPHVQDSNTIDTFDTKLIYSHFF